MIRPTKESDIDIMVELFTSYINNSFFAELGRTFLRPFLKVLVQSPYVLSFIYSVESKIIGFICSTYDCSGLFREIFIKRGIVLGMVILKRILKKPVVLKNLWESALYVLGVGVIRDSIKAELLFIAIEPDYRLRGVATQLINHTLVELKKRGVQKVRVSADQCNISVNRLLQKLDFELISPFQLFGKRMFLYNRQI
jgi:ribosomal protein S18 acetylase RimI-like enzyme